MFLWISYSHTLIKCSSPLFFTSSFCSVWTTVKCPLNFRLHSSGVYACLFPLFQRAWRFKIWGKLHIVSMSPAVQLWRPSQYWSRMSLLTCEKWNFLAGLFCFLFKGFKRATSLSFSLCIYTYYSGVCSLSWKRFSYYKAKVSSIRSEIWFFELFFLGIIEEWGSLSHSFVLLQSPCLQHSLLSMTTGSESRHPLLLEST